MHIELVHFFCGKCSMEVFMDSKTVLKRKKKTGEYLCDNCYQEYNKITGEKYDKKCGFPKNN